MDNLTDNRQVLIVDDNPTNLDVLFDYLDAQEFEVLVAESGDDALEQLNQIKPDIILLDVMMPGLDGFETCRRLKSSTRLSNIPVIFMTALNNEKDRVKGFEVGAIDYVTKPLFYQEVMARINTHLTVSMLQKQLQRSNDDLEKRVKQRTQRLQVIARVSERLSHTLELQPLLFDFVREMQTSFGYYSVNVYLVDDRETQLTLAETISPGGTTELARGSSVLLDRPGNLIAHVARTKKAILIENIQQSDQWLPNPNFPKTKAQAILPIVSGDKVIGVLDVHDDQAGTLTELDLDMLRSLANQASVAIANAQLYTAAQQANKDKDKFFSILAHDLKSPFMPLLGNAEFLVEMAERLPPEKTKRIGRSIHQSAKTVLNLLENLLSWSQMQMGRLVVQPTSLNLHQLTQLTLDLLTAKAKEKQIVLDNQIPPNTFAHADAPMVETVIRNLISNALKFTPLGGQITIQATNKLSSPQTDITSNVVEVSVTDTGVGLSQADLDKLFKENSLHSTVGTDDETGTGLGLMLCQEMIERNGGRIWIESELGRGTTVKFTLPTTN